MAVSNEKLAELDGELDALSEGESDVSSVLGRFDGERADLAAIDSELESLGQNIEVTPIASPVVVDPSLDATHVPEAAADPNASWDGDHTEVEVIDAEDDFVLLVDEDDLEELEAASEETPNVTVPPPIPSGSASADDEDTEDEQEDEGFFKKLFGSRRPSNRP